MNLESIKICFYDINQISELISLCFKLKLDNLRIVLRIKLRYSVEII